MDSAKALVQRVDTPYARAMLQLAETARLLYTGRRFEDACTAATAAQETFARECKGAFWEHAITANLHVTCLEYVGDMARHARLTAQFQREADERDDTFLAIILTLARALGFVMADDIEGSFAYLEQQSQWVTFSSGTWMLWWFRNVEALMYAGRSRQAVEVVESEWPRFAKSPHFYCEFVRESARYTRARCAVAAYCERTDPALRAHAWKTTRAIQDSATVHGAYRAGMLGALQAAGGDREAALRSLHLSSDRFRSAQCSLASLYPERIIHQLTRNHAGLARVDDEMHRQGIKNPERYNWICIPSSSA
jgi:hypothetical protein